MAAAAIAGVTVLVLATPAPAAAARARGDSTIEPATGPGSVVVNEFAPSGPFGSTDEFVELHNVSDHVISLDEWVLEVCLLPIWPIETVVFGPDDTILPGDYLLLAHQNYTGFQPPDYLYEEDAPDDGGWLLSDPWTGYADGVGSAGGLDCTEGDPAPQCDWADGEAVTRDQQGKDTDDNLADFSCEPRTPGR